MVEAVTVTPDQSGPTLEEEAAAQEAAAAAAKEGEDKPLPSDADGEDKGDRPEWLPEKFSSPEDMAKAYAELEAKQSAPKDGEEGEEVDTSEAEKVVESAGLDMSALQEEFDTNGELSEDSMKALEAVGITKEIVDGYVKGIELQQEALKADLLSPVGGEEAYAEMTSWAADNLSEAEIEAFDTTLEGGNPAQIKMAVENLHNKFVQANGQEPARELNGKGPAKGAGVYNSVAEVTKDMQDPRYANDPAFRAKVEQKLARSDVF